MARHSCCNQMATDSFNQAHPVWRSASVPIAIVLGGGGLYRELFLSTTQIVQLSTDNRRVALSEHAGSQIMTVAEIHL